MESDLIALGEKVRRAVETLTRVRVENTDMRQRIATLETDNKRLTEKVTTATARLEALLSQLPE